MVSPVGSLDQLPLWLAVAPFAILALWIIAVLVIALVVIFRSSQSTLATNLRAVAELARSLRTPRRRR